MASDGYIKLFRSMMSWEWYTDANTMRVFLHILLNANHRDKEFRGMTIRRGEWLTSYNKIATALGLSKKQVRLSIDKLKRTQEVRTRRARDGALDGLLIIVENYALYQDYDSNATHDITHELTNEQHSDNTAITLTKESKESKEYKECLVSASVGDENDLEKYDLWSQLSDNDIDRICDKYPNTGLTLIGEVAKEVKDKKREIKSPRQYVLGYATRKKWDDNQSFVMPWEV